jgi:hypothetical protein
MENKIYCTNDQGDALLYIEIIDDPLECTMTLQCSIDRQLISNRDTERMIGCIEERVVTEPYRREFIERLFKYIKKIPDIEKYYL